jgi:hypothetical protein
MSNVRALFFMLRCLDASLRASLCGSKQENNLAFREKVALAQRELAAPDA